MERYTEDMDDAIRVDADTDAEDVHEFVKRRVRNPVEADGGLVWNFSTHEPNETMLNSGTLIIKGEHFVIPYQYHEVWRYIGHLLPPKINQAIVLRYNPEDRYYDVYKNYFRDTDEEERNTMKDELKQIVEED